MSRFAAGALLLVLSACARGPKQQSPFRVEPNPPHVGLETFYFRIPKSARMVTLEGDMAHPGMPPVMGRIEARGEGGEYRGQLDLNMPGDWIISVKARSQHGDIIEQEFPITVSEK